MTQCPHDATTTKGVIDAQYAAMTTRLITVAETLPFLRQVAGLWHEDEHRAFVDYIAANPEAGDVIPDTGGVRKVRWSRAGMGKRGGRI